jgi:hypothetical protein
VLVVFDIAVALFVSERFAASLACWVLLIAGMPVHADFLTRLIRP